MNGDASTGLTPSQTVGPFFAYGLSSAGAYAWPDAFSADLVTPDASGERIRIVGVVTDGDDAAVPDAMLEIWQADAQGRYADPKDGALPANTAFRGFGRCGTSTDGSFAFDTIKPGAVRGPSGALQSPHIVMAVFARGLLLHAYTRIYFSDEDNASDAVMALVPAERRDTLIAQRDGRGVYRFDVRLQGENETVFFAV